MNITETHDSRKITSKQCTLDYFLWGSNDDQLALALLLSTYPATITDVTGAVYKNPEYELNPLRGGSWQGTVTYGRDGPFNGVYEPGLDDPLSSEDGISIDISPNTYKIFQSIETVDAIALDGIPPLFNRAINVNRGKVEGVELGNAAFIFNIQRTREVTTIRYIQMLKRLQYTTNIFPFFGWQAAEVLFLGATAQAKDNKPFVFDYKFGVEVNQAYFEIADGLVFQDKKGWDYAWALYNDDIDESKLIQTPFAAYLEQVFDKSDFAFLDL